VGVKTWSGRLLLAALLGVLARQAGACHSAEPVIPFMDAGDPCSAGGDAHAIDCAQFAETTCVVQGSTCPRETYGCADAAYFTKDDYSDCPEGGGVDAPLLGDVSLLGDGAVIGEAGDGGDAADGGDAGD
jgi:hypothetical protein